MLKHSARDGYRGSIPWPGRGRSQRTRDPIGRCHLAKSYQQFHRIPPAGANANIGASVIFGDRRGPRCTHSRVITRGFRQIRSQARATTHDGPLPRFLHGHKPLHMLRRLSAECRSLRYHRRLVNTRRPGRSYLVRPIRASARVSLRFSWRHLRFQ